MSFPVQRLRRLRQTPTLRRMVRETTLTVDDVVMPYFVCPGEGIVKPISSMPGNAQRSVDTLVDAAGASAALGVPAVILFGIPATKDPEARSGYGEDAIVTQAIRALKAAHPALVVMADVCCCEYTDHGHCGPLREGPHGPEVDNDATLEILAAMSTSYAAAGADIIAPSDMMDGRVGRIRAALDGAGHAHVPILSYAAKFASGFYGPFREAAESPPSFGDRKGYQMDPANGREALREVACDIDEGADMVMVKPALAYLDVIRAVRERWDVPIAAYNVSGEFSMLKAAAERGWLDERTVALEMLTSIKRAGADMILTYWADDVARWLA